MCGSLIPVWYAKKGSPVRGRASNLLSCSSLPFEAFNAQLPEASVACFFVFVYSSTVRGWLLAKVQHGALQSWLQQWQLWPCIVLFNVTGRVFLYRAERRIVGCHLVTRGCGTTQVQLQSNAQCAQLASSGRLVVTKLHARFYFGRVGFEICSHTQLYTTFTHRHNLVTTIFHTHYYVTHTTLSRTTLHIQLF